MLDDVEKAQDPRPTPNEIGVSGAHLMSGQVVEDEADPSLRGDVKYKTYSNLLLNTSIIAASVRYYLNLVTKAGWRFTPSEEDKEQDSKFANKVEAIVNDLETPFHRVIRRAAMFRFYGFSLHEWTIKKTDDGDWGFFDIAARPQRTVAEWKVDEKGRVTGIVQEDPETLQTYEIPRWKLMYVIDDSLNDSPEGSGVFRHLADPAKRLERYEQLEGYGFESDLRGVPIGRAPLAELNRKLAAGEIDQATYDRYIQPVKDFLRAHFKSPRLGMLLDSQPYTGLDEAGTPSNLYQWDLELLRGSPTSLLENANAIDRLNLEMARIMGTEHLLIGGDGKGSMALSTDKSHNFALIVEASLKEIQGAVQKDVVDTLWLLNGWDDKFKPMAEPEPIRFRSPEQITKAVLDLARSGAIITPDDPLVNAMRDVLNLPHTLPPEERMLQIDPLTGQPINPEAQAYNPAGVPTNAQSAGLGQEMRENIAEDQRDVVTNQ